MPATPIVAGYFDPNNVPAGKWSPFGHVRGATAVAVSTTVSPTQQFMTVCAASASMTCTLADGTTITIAPPAGDKIYPMGLQFWSTASGTISAVYNLY